MIKSAQEGMPLERMVLGDKTNIAAWASSYSEVRISEFQVDIFSNASIFLHYGFNLYLSIFSENYFNISFLTLIIMFVLSQKYCLQFHVFHLTWVLASLKFQQSPLIGVDLFEWTAD